MKKGFQYELRSWNDMWELSKEVAHKIRDSKFKPELIIAIARGGLVPAMNLSDILDVKDILCMRVEHWGKTAQKDKKAKIKTGIYTNIKGKVILLVDDVADTGESINISLKYIESLKPREVKTAVLIYKSQSRFKPDFYGEKTEKWRWIIFPWNITEDLCNMIEKISEKKKNLNPMELKDDIKREFNLGLNDIHLNYAIEEFKKRTHKTY